MLNDKKTIKENQHRRKSYDVEMSLRMLGGTEENVSMGSLESLESGEDSRADERTRKLGGKTTRPSEDAMYLRKEIVDAIRRTSEKIETHSQKVDEKMETYDEQMESFSKKTDENMDTFLQKSQRFSRITASGNAQNHCEK